MKTINIAVTPRHVENKDGEFLSVERRYLDFWYKYGYNLSVIPFVPDKETIKNYVISHGIKALLIAGGYKYYSSEIQEFEKIVISLALEMELPIFGVCCGLWSINGYFGGKLRWNEDHSKRNFKFISKYFLKKLVGKKHIPTHKVIVKDLFNGEAEVNSYHRKVVDRLGGGLTPFVWAEDGEVEGIYNKEKKILALQFHLEHGSCSEWFEKTYMDQVKSLIGA